MATGRQIRAGKTPPVTHSPGAPAQEGTFCTTVTEARQPHLIAQGVDSYSEGILPMGIGARNSQSAVALVL